MQKMVVVLNSFKKKEMNICIVGKSKEARLERVYWEGLPAPDL